MKALLNLSETNYIELGKIIGWEITETKPFFVIKIKVNTFIEGIMYDFGFYKQSQIIKAYKYLENNGFALQLPY